MEGDPPFIVRGEGCTLIDEDGNRYVDLIGSWGPLILGPLIPGGLAAVQACGGRGDELRRPHRARCSFAEELVDAHPTLEMVRLCSSGTEATMHAVRLARFFGRDHIIKIDGCYHGAHDSVLVAAGSGVATFAQPGSPGIPGATAGLTLTAPYNDADAIERHLQSHDVAAVLVEPVPGNMGCIVPGDGYLQRVSELCRAYGAVFILDEVMTGFRLARGGAAERLDVAADLVCLGKIVGGGLPLAAFGGRREIMERLSPVGPVYQAGTLSGNPVAVAAGRATLAELTPERYARLEAIGQAIDDGIRSTVEECGASMARVGSMFTIFFRASAPQNLDEVRECDFDKFGRFHRAALDHGVYLPPSQYEAAFLPSTLGDADLKATIDSICRALRSVDGSASKGRHVLRRWTPRRSEV